LKEDVKTYTTETLAPLIEKHIEELPAKEAYSVQVSKDGEKIWFTYPSTVENTDEYLKSQVLFEYAGQTLHFNHFGHLYWTKLNYGVMYKLYWSVS